MIPVFLGYLLLLSFGGRVLVTELVGVMTTTGEQAIVIVRVGLVGLGGKAKVAPPSAATLNVTTKVPTVVKGIDKHYAAEHPDKVIPLGTDDTNV